MPPHPRNPIICCLAAHIMLAVITPAGRYHLNTQPLPTPRRGRAIILACMARAPDSAYRLLVVPAPIGITVQPLKFGTDHRPIEVAVMGRHRVPLHWYPKRNGTIFLTIAMQPREVDQSDTMIVIPPLPTKLRNGIPQQAIMGTENGIMTRRPEDPAETAHPLQPLPHQALVNLHLQPFHQIRQQITLKLLQAVTSRNVYAEHQILPR